MINQLKDAVKWKGGEETQSYWIREFNILKTLHHGKAVQNVRINTLLLWLMFDLWQNSKNTHIIIQM